MILSKRGELTLEGNVIQLVSETLHIIDALRKHIVDECPLEELREHLQTTISNAMIDVFYLGIDEVIERDNEKGDRDGNIV